MKKIILFLMLSMFSAPAFAAFQISSYTSPTSGVAITYFTISKITVNPAAQTIQVGVSGYITQEAFVQGLQPVFSQSFTISGATYTSFLASLTSADLPSGSAQGTLLSELVSSLQTNMLTLPFFANATIVP